jgi:uncharacterized protein (PEP-CTERM system associated)
LLAASYGLIAVTHAQDAPSGGAATGSATPGAASSAGGDAGASGPRGAIESVSPNGVNQRPAPPSTAPAWTVNSAITLREEWSDNVLDTATDRRASFVTVVTPSLSINGATSRLTADLSYAPSFSAYTPDAPQNQFGQSLGADALLTLSPEELFVRATGYAAVESLNGATAAAGNQVLSQRTQAQVYDFSIEPYLTHRFGGWGTAQVGAAASQTMTGALNGGATVQTLTTRREFATFTSGENLGRLSDTLTLSATQDSGTGALNGAYQDLVSDQIGYAITRGIIALASLGWEDIKYSGAGAPHYNDATWSVGARLLPNPDSVISVGYGHQGGATAAQANASYAPTATIRLSAQYSAGVTTAAQTLNNALAGASFDAFGHPIDPATGVPLDLGNNFFGFNTTVYQAKTLTASVAWLLPRDAWQLSVQRQTQTPVGAAGATVIAASGGLTLSQGLASTSGTTGTLSWQHDLSPLVSTTLSTEYGVLGNVTPLALSNGVLTATGKQARNVALLAINAQISWQLTRTLTGQLQYGYTSNDYGNGLPGVSSNLVAVELRKTF